MLVCGVGVCCDGGISIGEFGGRGIGLLGVRGTGNLYTHGIRLVQGSGREILMLGSPPNFVYKARPESGLLVGRIKCGDAW